MVRRFHFADATWFSTPLKLLMVATSVFAMLALYPAFGQGTSTDQHLAIFGLAILLAFVATGSVVSVAMRDGCVELGGDVLRVRFEAFFSMAVPLSNIARASRLDVQPRWRYRFGLSTNFVDRIVCSHGGDLVELELVEPMPTKVGFRTIALRRLWLAVEEHEALLDALRERIDAAQTAA